MLTDLVRCTVLAEDLRQVTPHCEGGASTPYRGTTCSLQQLLEKVRSALGLRDCIPRKVETLMATLEARSVVGLAGAEKRGGRGDEDDAILVKSDGETIFRITAIKNRFHPFWCFGALY